MNIWEIESNVETTDFKASLFTPDQDWETHDILSGIKRDLSFKNVMKAIAGNASLDEFDCETNEEYSELMAWIGTERWTESEETALSVALEEGILTKEEAKKISESEKTFDILLDFDAYYADFIEFFNINLLKDKISFFEFKWLLSSVTSKEKGITAQRIRYRSYKKAKNDSNEYAQFMHSQKNRFALSDTDTNIVASELFSKTKTLGGA